VLQIEYGSPNVKEERELRDWEQVADDKRRRVVPEHAYACCQQPGQEQDRHSPRGQAVERAANRARAIPN